MTGPLELLAERSAVEPFKGFRCWSPSEVGEIMHREAAAPSRAVLLATHQPPRIRRVTVTEAGRYGSDDAVAQDDVLRAVLEEGDQSLIVPIIGASGSGKSHLVLWMRAKLEEFGSPHRKIIYLPKGETSLTRVIDLILDGRTGGSFDQIREAVSKATRAMSLSEAARRLRDELAVAASGIDQASEGSVREPFRQHVKEYIGNLLDDPVYSDRLIGVGGPLRRIVEQALSGGSEEPAELKHDDIDVNLTSVELEPLSSPAKTFLGDLKNPALYDEAIAVLNEARDRCMSRIFGIEPMQLVEVMRQLRERLHEEDPELEIVLMIEDFRLFQGIQHELLEAMIELPRRGGQQVMCGMKTVMAVTEGFFDKMLLNNDTLRTRIAAQGHVYNLDVQYAADSTGALDAEAVAEFAGRYLNAVRAGASAIDEASPAVPSACERCKHVDVCHDAFGTSTGQGFGLYPFNAMAIDRMVRSRQDKFNPRDLLAVVAQTLTTYGQEIADGRFPSRSWERSFDPRQHDRPQLPTLSLQTQGEVEALPKADQRAVLLTFWGGVPAELRNLPPSIHTAFDIPEAPAAPVTVPVPTPDPVKPPPVRATDDIANAVHAWRDGGELQAEIARTLRRVFREAITAAFDPEAELCSAQFLSEFFDRDTDIDILKARGRGRPSVDRFSAEFAPTNDNALLFQGVLRAQRQGNWAFEDGHAALVGFVSRVDAEAARLRKFLSERLAERQADHNGALALLAVSGLVAGQGTAADARGLLAAALSLKVVVSETMPERWQVLVRQLEGRRAATRDYALQGAHVSKSTAEPAAVDGGRFLGALRDLSSEWVLPEVSEAAPQPVHTLRKVLVERLAPALEEARDVLVKWDAEMTRLVGDPETVGERAKSWRAALDEAHKKGFLVTTRGYTADGSLPHLAPTCRIVRSVVTQWPDLDLGHRVAAVAKVPWARLAPLREQLLALEATFRASSEKATTQGSPDAAGSPVERFEKAINLLRDAARLSPGGEA